MTPLSQHLDLATFQFTTNRFEFNDLALANGTNTFVLRVRDRAGNCSTNSYTYTLSFSEDATAPVLTLVWPQNGQQVCETNITVRGQLDDPSAVVMAQVVDAGGVTNLVRGLVERDGRLWVDNLPLGVGTNTVTLTMTDAATNSSSNSLLVVRADDVKFSIDPVPPDELVQPTGTVTGTINTNNFTIWINGVKATNYWDNGNGTWTWAAYEVPLNQGGSMVVFDTVAIPNWDNEGNGSFAGGGGGSGGAGAGTNPGSPAARGAAPAAEQGASVFIETFVSNYVATLQWSGYTSDPYPSGRDVWFDLIDWTNQLHWTNWATLVNGTSGRDTNGAYYRTLDPQGAPSVWYVTNSLVLPLDKFQLTKKCITTTVGSGGGPWTTTNDPPQLPDPQMKWSEHVAWKTNSAGRPGETFYTMDRDVRTTIKLRTGGRDDTNRMNLFIVWGYGTEYIRTYPWSDYVTRQIPPADIQVPSLGKHLDERWQFFKALPDNVERDLTPVAPPACYTFSIHAQKHTLTNVCYAALAAALPLATNRQTVGVGEAVNLYFDPVLPTLDQPKVSWTTTTGSVSQVSGNTTWFSAPSNAVTATVKATIEGEEVPREFTVLEPNGVYHADFVNTIPYSGSGAGMHIRPYLAPTNVSFYRVKIIEVGQNASGVTGYYTNYMNLAAWPTNLAHTTARGANQPLQILYNNAWQEPWDNAAWGGDPGPWSTGSFYWDIPGKWNIPGGPTNDIPNHWTQSFSITGSGTVTVRKFDCSVTR